MGREEDQCQSGGDSAGKMTSIRFHVLPLMPPWSLHLPNYHKMFLWNRPSFCYICLLGGMSGERNPHNWTKKQFALLPSPLCTGLYLMYIQSHPVILQSTRGCREWSLCIGPLGKAGLPKSKGWRKKRNYSSWQWERGTRGKARRELRVWKDE